jgi:hypothetical protein
MGTSAISQPLSNIIPISVVVSPIGLPGPKFNQALFIGASTVLGNQRLAQYNSIGAVAQAGFPASSPEFQAASLYFQQVPKPFYVWIGRQFIDAAQTLAVSAVGSGYQLGDVVQLNIGGARLIVTGESGGAVSTVAVEAGYQGSGYIISSTPVTTTAITGIGIGLTVTVTAIGETPLQAVIACRQATSTWYLLMFAGGMGASGAATTANAGAGASIITVQSNTGLQAGQVVVGAGITPGTTLVLGQGFQWTLSAPTTAVLNNEVLTFYAPFTDSDHVAVAGYVESSSTPTQYFLTSGEPSILINTPATGNGTAAINTTQLSVANVTGNIAAGQLVSSLVPGSPGIQPGTVVLSGTPPALVLSLPVTAALAGAPLGFSGNLFATLKALNYNRTVGQYATTQNGQFPPNAYASAAPMGAAMGSATGNPGSYFALMYLPLSGIATEPLTTNQLYQITGSPDGTQPGLNGNVYTNYASGAYAVFQNGKAFAATGRFFDVTLFLDMLQAQIQINAMNLLTENPSIPLNQQGVVSMLNVIGAACVTLQGIGFINTGGIWQGIQIGPWIPGSVMPKGWAVYAPPVSTLTTAQKANRQFPPVNVLVILAESGQSIAITINVQQ